MTEQKAKKQRDPRDGLRTSTTLATLSCLIGHFFLGFEQAWLDVVYALGAGYLTAFVLEYVDAKANGRPIAFLGGGWKRVLDFLLAPHMTAITTSFIIYVQDHHWAMALAVVAAISSKFIFRVKIDGRYRHFFNPSNFGIAFTLTVLPWASSIPWQYMSNMGGVWKYIIPLVALVLGLRLNIIYTKRVPVIIAFVIAFIFQGMARALIHGTHFFPELAPLTGFVMVLFLLYMITDPMTSPSRLRSQIIFGAAMPLVYGVLMMFQTVYVLFYAVWIVAAIRGIFLYVESLRGEPVRVEEKPRMPVMAPQQAVGER